MPELEKETGKEENQFLIFKLAEEDFGIQIQQVREILRLQEIHRLPQAPDFIEGIRHITAKLDIPLVFDEVTSGLRMTPGGIHLKLGVEPDIAVFAKALGNGYPMAAIIGRANVMSAAQRTFISSSYWTDKIGPVAALATLRKHIKCNVSAHLVNIGKLVQDGWKSLGIKYGLDIKVTGIPPLSHWVIGVNDSQLLHTIIIEVSQGRFNRSEFASIARLGQYQIQFSHQLEAVAYDHHRRAKLVSKLTGGDQAQEVALRAVDQTSVGC